MFGSPLFVRPFSRKHTFLHTLHKAVTVLVLASLLAGLIPPPLVTGALPNPVADLAEALLPGPALAQAAGGAITGTVFQDYNADGVRNTTSTTALPAVDNGVGGVTVTAYDADGAQCGQTTTSTTTATLGQYTLTHTCAAATVRVEFTNLPTGYYSGPQGTNSGSSVQFVSATASNVNYGINHPCDYCQNAPTLATTYMVAGNQMTNTGVSSLPNTKVVVSFGYNSTTSTALPTGEAMAKQVGTTLGLAYQRSTKTIFVGAYMKRHAGFGPGGPGAIYTVNPGADGVRGNADDVVSTFLDLDAASYFGAGSFGVDPHPTTTENIAQTPYNWFHDNQSLDDVTKMGFGDLDMSEDDQELYAVNLFDRSLYRIPVGNPPTAPAKAAITVIGAPTDLPGASQGCVAADVRPFGLGVYRQLVYLGMICSAQSTQVTANLRAYVYSFDPATNSFGAAPVLEFPLTYTRSGNFTKSWKPYMDTFATIVASTATDGAATFTNYPQPILSDIAFDRGAMILGLRDRAGDQLGKYAGDVGTGAPGNFYYVAASGDILRACANGSSWTIENDGSCGGVTTTGSSSSNAGPGGGEFYLGDKAPYPNGTNHVESSEGTLAQVPGAPEIVMSAIDATALNSGGFEWLNNTTGLLADAYKVYQSANPSGAPTSPSTSGTPDTTFGKAGGIGDVEALCDPAPLEIGNRIWNDANGNGIQDADEAPISGVTVTLHDSSGTLIATAVTDANGNYIFSNGTGTDTASAKYELTALTYSTADFELRIDTTQGALSGLSLTTANADASANGDLRDSDAVLDNTTAKVIFATGAMGANNHTYDFGFTAAPPPLATLKIVKQVSGGSVSVPFTVTVTGPNSYNTIVTVVPGTPTQLTNLEVGQYTVVETPPSISSAPAGYAWAGVSYTPIDGAVTLGSGMTGTITVTNMLSQEPFAPTGVLTVTKTVDWNGQTPNVSQEFTYTITGPNGFTPLIDTIKAGEVNTYSLPTNIYTVTESLPDAGWTTIYTATSGSGGSEQAVVNLQNVNIATLTPASISGKVFRDFNNDGTMTTSGNVIDVGLAGVTVTAYDVNGNAVGSTQSGGDGVYSLLPTANGPWRIEFSALPEGYEPSLGATSSSTQFVLTSGATNLDLAVNKPCEYCQDNPPLAAGFVRSTTNYNGGNSAPQGIYAYSLTSLGTTTYEAGNPAAPIMPSTELASGAEVGNVQGITWRASSRTLFAAAYGRNTDGTVANQGLGPGGLGGIYAITNGTVTTFATVSNVGAFAGVGSVGKVGIGGIELSTDENTLYAVNMFAKTLVVIPIVGYPPTAGAQNQIALPQPADCAADHTHSFGLGSHDNKIYIGMVCGGPATTDLRAYVYEYDGNSFAQQLNFSMNYVRTDHPDDNNTNDTFNNIDHRVIVWEDNPPLSQYHNGATTTDNNNATARERFAPMLVDIVFDDDDMVLGFRSRLSDQAINSEWTIGGELLRACAITSGGATTWQVENNGVCNGTTSTTPPPVTDAWIGKNTGLSTSKGPGGYEYYWGDNGFEGEMVQGSLAQIPGSRLVYASQIDALGHRSQHGIAALNHDTGATVAAGNMAFARYNFSGTSRAMKSNQMGDLEVLCDPAPISIGNRVWDDLDGDGVQDPGEPGINGITVSLQGPTNTVTTATTDDGNYYFTVTPNTLYTITVQVPGGYQLAAANTDALDAANLTSNHAISDTRDSDAVLVNGTPTIYYTTGGPGQNNHGLDFGFTQPINGQVDILNTAPAQQDYDLALRKRVTNQTANLDGSRVATYTIEVFNQGDVAASNIELVDYLPANTTLGTPANGWTVSGSNLLRTVPGPIAPGDSTTVDLVLDIGAVAAGNWVTNTAEIAVDDGDDIDSTPDTTNDDEVVDDVINDNPTTGTDEDDHDIAVAPPICPAPTIWNGGVYNDSQGAFVTNVEGLDWSSAGSGVFEGIGPIGTSAPTGTQFTLRYQSYLFALNAPNGSVIPFNGLNSVFEYTIVAEIPMIVLSETNIPAANLQILTLATRPGGQFFIYHDANPNYDVPIGVGFDDGSLVASGYVNGGQFASFTYSGGASATGSFSFIAPMSYVNADFLNPIDKLAEFRLEGTLNSPALDSTTTTFFAGRTGEGNFEDYSVTGSDILLKVDTSSKLYECIPDAQFGDRVFIEDDGDGLANTGAIIPVEGIVITATNGSEVYTTTTDVTGYYSFSVPSGAYTVTYGTVPAGYGTVVHSTVVSGTSESGNAGSYQEPGNPDANHGQATVVTLAAGEANWQVDFAFTPVVPPVPNPGGFAIHKAIATMDGSSPSVSGSFNVVVSCAGASAYPTTLSLNADGTPVTAGNLISGTVCSFSEDTLTLPAAPNGYTWVNAQISPASITIQSDVTTTVTATNWLAPLPEPPTTVLTVTKTINGAGSGPFDITITGSNHYSTTAQINGGDVLTFSVPLGVYTVTESSPGLGWVTVYTATPGYSTGSSAVVTLTNASTAPVTAPGAISGNVFRDFDADGVDDGANEIGVAGVIVTAYDRDGVAQGTATTDADGNYTLNTTGSGPYRLEFTNLPTGYAPTMHGAGNGTSTQFVSAPASNVNLGVNHPMDYSQANPDMFTSVYINGDTNSTAPTGTLVKFAYNSSGASPTPTTLATKAQIGSTWGLAYARSTETIYAAAFLKRHVGLGPNGPGAIYAIDINGGTPTLFADLATLGANVGTVLSNSARGLGEPTSPNNDPTTFDQVAKVGLGDMDISADERTLYVVSLNDKRLYVLNIPAGTLANSYAIPDPGCTGGDWRPFGLKYRLGSVYVGGVCDAATSQQASDLQATVYEFDGASFTNVLSFALDYPKGNTSYRPCPGTDRAWHPWVATMPCNESVLSYPEPILSDIEFDVDGSMILGFSDRFTHQTGNANYPPMGTTLMYSESGGDILRACYVGNSFALQGNSGCPNKFTNDQGPGGGEYYNDISGYDQHNAEGAQGGLALLPGRGEVATTGDDPTSIRAGGVYWMNNNSGAKVRAYDIYTNGSNNSVTFAKGTGLGDLELLVDPAPIEIGNRVWNDLNGNGVQDPGEPGINGVQVSLQSPTGTVGTVTTSGDGNYYFNNVVPNTPYTITIDSAQMALSGLRLTVANTQAISGSTASNNAILDTRDSDAVLVGGVATIYYTTGSAGQNNHGLDFGFTQPVSGQVDILNSAPPILPAQFGDRVLIESDGDGLASTGVITPVASMVITATNGSEVYTTTTNAAGYYSFTVPGTLPGQAYTVTYGTVPAGYGAVVPSAVISGTESGNAGSYQEAGSPDANHSPQTSVTVAGGEANWHVDFLFTPLPPNPRYSLGNRLWLDDGAGNPANRDNGVYDAGESPVAEGVVVELLNITGTVIATTTTDVTGYYRFDNLAAGDYRVRIPAAEFQPGGKLAGLSSSSGYTDTFTTGENNLDHGDDDTSDGVTSAIITLRAANPTGEADGVVIGAGANGTSGDANDNLTVDFGFVPPLAQFGDRVFIEDDGDGLANTGNIIPVAGIVITATNGSEVYTTTTNALGYYSFTVPGTLPGQVYTVTYGTVPTGYGTVAPSAVVSGTTASGNAGSYAEASDPDANHGQNTVVTVASGEANWQVDFAFTPVYVHIGDRLWIEDDNDGDATTGNVTPVVGQVVTATASSGAVYTATTDSNGLYTITVPANDTYTVTTGIPANVVDAPLVPNAGNNENHDRLSTTVIVTTTDNLSLDFGYFAPTPMIEVVKYTNGDDADLATGPVLAVGEMVTWTYDVTNTGNVTLTNIVLADDVEGSVSCPLSELAPGAGMTCVLTGTTVAGQYGNTAVVTGTPTLGPVTAVTDTNPSHYYGGNPGIELVKYTNGYDANNPTGPYIGMGEVVTWTYVITNTGSETLTNLALVDDVEGAITCPVGSLAPGASTTCVTTGTATAGQYVNTAVVSGTTPGGSVLTFTNPSHYYGVDPSIALRKYTNGEDADTIPGPTINEGDSVTWTYIVTNTGNVNLTDVTLVDDIEGSITCPATDLATGASMICTWTGIAVAGQYTNTAVVTGTPSITPNPTPELPGYPTQPTPTDPVTDTNPSHYFGQLYVDIGNRLWIEDDNDGDATTGNVTPVVGQVVTATASSGAVYTATTDSNGLYTITVPANDTYTVTTGIPADVVAAPLVPNAGNDENHDRLATAVVITTTDNLTIDFGYYQPAQFGDRVWIESDDDGLASTGDITPVAGMLITATNGTDIYTTTTDADGYYSFIVPGGVTYTVTYGDVPTSYGAVEPSATPGGSSEGGDAGSYQESGNPDQSHANGTTVYVDAGEANWHIDFAFTPLPVQLGDRVFIEDDGDGLAATGVITPVAGMVITVTNGTDIYTTTTNADGYYSFTVPADTYTVAYGTVPAGYGDVTPSAVISATERGNAGSYGEAGNPDANHVQHTTVTLAAGEANWQVDFAFTPLPAVITYSLGNRLWIDDGAGNLANRDNGRYDAGEVPVAEGVVVELLNITGTVIATTTTNLAGYYRFDGLAAGDYRVRIPAGEFQPGGHLVNLASSTGFTTNFTAGENNLDHGDDDMSDGVSSEIITLGANNPTGEVDGVVLGAGANGTTGDVNDNLTVDFGFVPPLAQFGDRIFIETDGDGLANTGDIMPIEGMVITATNGTAVYTTTTNAAGYYSFTVPGGVIYTVTYGDVPAAYGDVVPSATPGGNRESGPAGSYGEVGNPDQSHANGTTVYVEPGEANWHIDFAFWPPVFDLALRKVLAASTVLPVNAGDDITFTLVISNQGTVDAYNIEVSDYLPTGLSLSGNDTNGWNGTGNVVTNTVAFLAAGDETSIDIVLTIDAAFQGTHLTNVAEISAADDDTNPDNTPPTDIDSTPDDNPTNEDNVKDDVTDEDGAVPGEDEDDHDIETFPVQQILGAIGNYVWVDENSDGYQDAGEPGIPNVRVVLYDDQGTLVAETRTDSSGHYLFPDLPLGDYFVDVDETTIPNGMTQTPPSTLEGADFGNQDHSDNPAAGDYGYPATITPATRENLTADFGYNYNPQPDVDGGDQLAALGDRVWIDSDGDGAQDPEEIGVEGVVVTLYSDSAPNGLPDGIYDTVVATDTTDSNGYYLFDDLTPGAYVVEVTDSGNASHDVLDVTNYDQTGDPDHFGQPGTNNDNLSTAPVVLGPGDVYLNVDFGYQPANTMPLGSIGDTIWFDADADGNGPAMAPVDGGAAVNQGLGNEDDALEYGIPGVTVALIQDVNGDGVWQPASEPIVATDVTDENGQYLFTDLPLDDGNGDGDADYLVWVNDTDNVLAGLRPTYDYDNGTSAPNNLSARALDTATPDVREQDFGYTPVQQTPDLGLIGDTVWFDVDGSGGDQSTQGDEPGLEGVVMELLDNNSNVIATTTTDENGNYYFGGLPLDETYQVQVAPENFQPGGVLEDLSNTFDPNGGNDSVGPTVTLSTANPVDLDQDFSYAYVPPTGEPVGQIGNLVWLDPNANGVYEPELGENPIGGVTVDLYRDLNGNGALDPGEPLRASTVTSDTIDAGAYGSDGNYLFTGLPAGDYIVDVTDEDGTLAGYWHSLGDATTDNNSQVDPYAVTIGDGAPMEDLTADFGYYVDPAAVGNYVWHDVNVDGIQNDGETGINGVTVVMTITYPNGDETVLATVTTNDPGPGGSPGQPGWYSFGNLLLDEDYNGDGLGDEPTFTIRVDGDQPALAGYAPTLVGEGNDTTVDSDDHVGVAAAPVQGQTDTLRSNDDNAIASYDFGYWQPASLGDLVWEDLNHDGIQGVGESGIPGVTVTLTDSDGVTETATTDANGNYTFTNLTPGVPYTVTFTTPDGYEPTLVDEGNDATDNDGAEVVVTLDPGAHNPTIDSGFWQPASLGDYVWYDDNRAGIQDANEDGVADVTVELLDSSNTVILTTTTDVNGWYSFMNLIPGEYTIHFVTESLPTGYVLTTPAGTTDDAADSDADVDTGLTEAITLAAGEHDMTWDAGIYLPPASLGDLVWEDLDHDGSQDPNEPGIPNVPVTLTDSNGLTQTVTTDASGHYIFTDLVPGEVYTITFETPNGYEPTVMDNGDDASDSDGGVVVVILDLGETDLTIDSGFWQPASLGDTVWEDLDHDGSQDAGEPGIPGVMVTLTDSNGVTATLMTDANGHYTFTDLISGAPYTVDFATPDSYAPTLENVGDDARDSDGATVTTTLDPGEHDPTLDSGFWRPARLGDTVWEDLDHDGVQDPNELGIPGVTVTLTDADGNNQVVTTDESGNYNFDDLISGVPYTVTFAAPVGYEPTVENVGNDTADGDGAVVVVTLQPGETNPTIDSGYWRPAELGDTVWEDLDHDGIQDPNEPGIPGVPVTLTDSNGVTQTVTTDANGHYTFTDLISALPYTVTFATPDGYEPTLENVGDGTTDSDGAETVVILAPGEINPTIDSGFWRPLSLGNQVWEDLNNNGRKDNGELGMAGITVNLYRDRDNNGQPDGAALATTTTVGDGLYLFANLIGDNYIVEVVAPAGYVSSTPDGGDVDDNAADSDDNGMGDQGGLIWSAPVTLSAGDEPQGEQPDNDLVTPDANENLTVDFGLWRPLNLGNYIWLDSDRDGQQDPNEIGVPGLVVTLELADGTVLTTMTDATGHYTFTHLLPNQTVTVTVTPPDGYSITIPNNGDDALDSDIDLGGVVVVNLGGTDDYTIDAGLLVDPVTVGNLAFVDMNQDGIQNEGDLPLAGVVLHLTHADGTPATDIFGNPVADLTTNVTGYYTFTNLLPGEYTVSVVSVPTGYTPTTPHVGTPDLDSSTGAATTSPTTGTAAQSGGQDLTLDFGFVPLVRLGNLVWHDANNNGQVDAGERGIARVVLQLFREGDDPLTATPVATTTSTTGGAYLFDNLTPGRYFVYIPTPSGLYPVSSTPTDEQDNNEDNDDNGSQVARGEPVRSPVIELTDNGEVTTDGDDADGNLTVDFGFFAPASLGDRVWYDTNQNGIQNPQERGVAGVVVRLYDALTNSVVATTTTDINGNYHFGDLAPGSYFVEFTVPTGYMLSPADQGGQDNRDSDADPTTLRTPTVTLQSGEHNPTLDMGIYLDVPPASIGDRVWYDTDQDGIQDPGERGVPGVVVELHRADGALVATATTGPNGHYEFDNLAPGDYYLVFVPPADYILSPVNNSDNDDNDSDVDPATGQTLVTTLIEGEDDMSWDLGLYLPMPPASIGDMVWFDDNANGVQDEGETGVPGVQVTLYTANGTPVATVTTDATGHYLFENLAPGEYYIVFTPPNGYVGTLPNQGNGDDAIDSDGNPATGQTPVTQLEPGEQDLTWDYGVFILDELGEDLIVPGDIGDYVWLDINNDGVQDATEVGMPNVTVNLYDTDWVLIAVDVTDADGNYTFPNLLPGDYIITVVSPPETVISPPDATTDDMDSDVDPATGISPVISVLPGDTIVSVDIGLVPHQANAIDLVSFTATAQDSSILIQWVTSLEENTQGFHLYVGSTNVFANATRLTDHLLLSQGSQGGVYVVTMPYNPLYDPAVEELTFWLVEVEKDGTEHRYGPIRVSNESLIFLPLITR